MGSLRFTAHTDILPLGRILKIQKRLALLGQHVQPGFGGECQRLQNPDGAFRGLSLVEGQPCDSWAEKRQHLLGLHQAGPALILERW